MLQAHAKPLAELKPIPQGAIQSYALEEPRANLLQPSRAHAHSTAGDVVEHAANITANVEGDTVPVSGAVSGHQSRL